MSYERSLVQGRLDILRAVRRNGGLAVPRVARSREPCQSVVAAWWAIPGPGTSTGLTPFKPVRPLLVLALVVFGIVVIAALRLWRLFKSQRDLSRDLAGANSRLESANLSFVTSLRPTLGARDQRTAGHSGAVAVYARDIAKELGLPWRSNSSLRTSVALSTTSARSGCQSGLLEKPGALTLAERRVMETHSEIGERILAASGGLQRDRQRRPPPPRALGWTGVSRRLSSGEAHPPHVTDHRRRSAYDAMTTDRPYQDAVPSRTARIPACRSCRVAVRPARRRCVRGYLGRGRTRTTGSPYVEDFVAGDRSRPTCRPER